MQNTQGENEDSEEEMRAELLEEKRDELKLLKEEYKEKRYPDKRQYRNDSKMEDWIFSAPDKDEVMQYLNWIPVVTIYNKNKS